MIQDLEKDYKLKQKMMFKKILIINNIQNNKFN